MKNLDFRLFLGKLGRSVITVSSTFFVWTTIDGTLAYTDNPKRVPKMYADQAEERTWDELRTKTDKKWTVGPKYGRQLDN